MELHPNFAKLIKNELESIPEEFQKPFNSFHEGLAVLREGYIELENEIFWGLKECQLKYKLDLNKEWADARAKDDHIKIVEKKAIKVAAMAVRIIQDLCK